MHKHRNFIYVVEKKIKGKWILEWDFIACRTYEIAEQCLKDFKRYNKNHRIVMYISEKPHDE